jgi:hypothetical protein
MDGKCEAVNKENERRYIKGWRKGKVENVKEKRRLLMGNICHFWISLLMSERV